MKLEPPCLQYLCMCFTRLNLERIPSQQLALLPLKFRKELLHSLPLADVCSLEETQVVQGISMEEVWLEVHNNLMEQLQALRLSLPYILYQKTGARRGHRESCYELIAFLVLHQAWPYSKLSVSELLFSVRLCDNNIVLPHRYSFFGQLSSLQLINAVMAAFRTLPKGLCVYCSTFRHTRLWKEDNFQVLKAFLQEIQCLNCYTSVGTESETEPVVSYIFGLCLSSHKLQSVSIDVLFHL